MPFDSNQLANEAILLMGGDQNSVTGQSPTFDDSTAGNALKQLYVPAFRAVLRQFGWDFSRAAFTLVLSPNVPPFPYTYEYLYPPLAVQLNSLLSAADDVNNPIPYNYNVANAVVNGVQQRVIWAYLVNALCRFTNAPNENTIDDLFHASFVRLLSSALAMAIGGKPDVAQAMLQSGSAFEQVGESRSD